jgi:hypothetical protein
MNVMFVTKDSNNLVILKGTNKLILETSLTNVMFVEKDFNGLAILKHTK